MRPLNDLWGQLWGVVICILQHIALQQWPLECTGFAPIWAKRPKITYLGENTLFTRFLMCPSIIFFWVSAWGSTSSFLNPKLGARLKINGFEGSQVHSQKVYTWTHSGEGGPGIHPERFLSNLWPILRSWTAFGTPNVKSPLEGAFWHSWGHVGVSCFVQ